MHKNTPAISSQLVFVLLYICFQILVITHLHRASPAYSLTAGIELGPAHELDAVRLLMSWLWDNGSRDWGSLKVEDIVRAMSSAEDKDSERVERHETVVNVVFDVSAKVKRQRH